MSFVIGTLRVNRSVNFFTERNCTEAVPNGNVYSPCPSGHSCTFTCDDGFRLHPIAQDYMKCENGEWVLSATKYDRKITPQTVCLPEGKNVTSMSFQ